MRQTQPNTSFRFRRHDTIGNPSAESDEQFLSACFVDTGALAILRDCADQRGIVLGRTGVGKTALLTTLTAREDHVVAINPHDLALSYISSSTILRFFEGLDIRMDPFYRFLWRHVFVVEILKAHLGLESEEQKARLLDDLRYRILRKKSYRDAFEYLNEYGTNFLVSTEERITDLTRKVETDLKASADLGLHGLINLGAEGARRLSEEQKYEVKQRGFEIINKAQNTMLSLLFSALDEDILTDRAKRYYIVIDRLDEDWVEDAMRYRLIRALIEIMRDFNSKVGQAKIVVALRADLFDRVLRATSDSGFQGEKYQGLCLSVTWQKPQLQDVLNARITELVRHQYAPQQPVTYRDVLPALVGKQRGREQPIDYILDRTLLRPRDVIAFFNDCMAKAEGEPVIQAPKMREAEVPYSRARLRSLADEWSVHYPHLHALCDVLKGRPQSFKLGDLTDASLDDLCLELIDVLDGHRSAPGSGEDREVLYAYYNNAIDAPTLRSTLARIYYRVGIVGLKVETYQRVSWAYLHDAEVTEADVNDQTTVHVHKMVWRALGIVTSS